MNSELVHGLCLLIIQLPRNASLLVEIGEIALGNTEQLKCEIAA